MAFWCKHHRVLVYQLARPDWAFQPDIMLSIYSSLTCFHSITSFILFENQIVAVTLRDFSLFHSFHLSLHSNCLIMREYEVSEGVKAVFWGLHP